MAKNCVYCSILLTAETETEDHVIAKSWFPDTTPGDVPHWVVPACRDCNNRFSRVEDDVRVQLAMCVDRKHAGAIGIVERALRSVAPQHGRDDNDRKIRELRQNRLLRGVRHFTEMPSHGVLPSFTDNFTKLGSRTAILIDAHELHMILKKWVRGLHYILNLRTV